MSEQNSEDPQVENFKRMVALLHTQENARQLAASNDGDAEVWELRAMDPLNDALFIVDYRRHEVSHVQRKDDPEGYGRVAKEASAT